MTASRRIVLCSGLGFLVAGLSGCGFRPLYGTSGITGSAEVVEELSRIDVRPIPDRRGMALRQVLREKLHMKSQPNGMLYDLQVQLFVRTQELGVRKDSTTSRANLVLTARFYLWRGRKRLLLDSVQSIVSFNILDDQYATIASESDAEDRALQELSDEIKTRLGVFFDNRLTKQTSATQ